MRAKRRRLKGVAQSIPAGGVIPAFGGKQVFISLFILLNLGTIAFINRPVWMVQKSDEAVQRMPSTTAYRFNYTGWLVRRYAHLAGLDNLWQMFGRQSRFNWWFEIKATYADGKTVLLPLPRQSPRTFWQATFSDFKEAKYHLNLYASQELRQRYAHHLFREYAKRDGAEIQSITFELHHQMLLEPPQSAEQRTHVAGPAYSSVLDHFTCPKKV